MYIYFLQVNVGTKRPRAWHIACALYSTPGECQIVVFGGNSHVTGESGVRENVSDLRILSFGKTHMPLSNSTTELCRSVYRRTGFNCESPIIALCEIISESQKLKAQRKHFVIAKD